MTPDPQIIMWGSEPIKNLTKMTEQFMMCW